MSAATYGNTIGDAPHHAFDSGAGAPESPRTSYRRDESFGTTLRRYRLRSGLSQNALAKVVGINASYINRLETGDREAPTRQVASALGRALTLAPEEIDRLMFSAGHVPPSLQKLGPADSTVAAVTRLLTNDRLSPEARADFRAIVETIAIRWQAGAMESPVRRAHLVSVGAVK